MAFSTFISNNTMYQFVSNNFLNSVSSEARATFRDSFPFSVLTPAIPKIVVDLVEQLAVIHSSTIEQVLDKICSFFPNGFDTTCQNFVNTYGPMIIAGFAAQENSDDICNAIKICQTPDTDQCRLHPPHSTRPRATTSTASDPNWKVRAAELFPSIPKETPWQWIMDLINRLAQKHEPIVDIDRDMYSDAPHLRGSTWRGKDCNDLDAKIHPGAKHNPYRGSGVDHDCNGIYGMSPDGIEWDQKLCKGSKQTGVVVMGDSAGAHFEIPPQYITASQIGPGTYKDLWAVVTDEIDRPHRSAYTGYENDTVAIPVRSLYKYVRARNLCNHRNFQNIAVNGARSGAILELSQALGKNSSADHPLLLVTELIGNDVCSPHHGPDSMTTPQEFYDNLVQFITNLDTRVPPGSSFVAFGVVKGSILYDILSQRIHPIGVTYERVYNLLNCLGANPCYMWLNSNATLRQMGDERAAQLNLMWPQVFKDLTGKLKNIQGMQYYDFPAKEILDNYKRQGGDPASLIEPVDGFHPGQLFHAYLGDWLYGHLLKDHPDWLGPINPNNDVIAQMFGEQGGY